MISKEHFKKSSEDARQYEMDARRWKRRRKLYFPCQNSSDTDVSDSIGDSVKQKSSSRAEDGILNASKFNADDEMASLNLFMPNVFKRAVYNKQTGAVKKSHAKKVDDSALGKLATSIMPSVAEGTKPWMQFCKNAQKALTVLNDEVSTALRDSFCSIDDIQIRIRRTMDEIRECDKMYEHLRLRQQTKSSPVSHSESHLNDEKRDGKLSEAKQMRSETQVRLGPLPSIAESIYETEPNLIEQIMEDTGVNDVVSEVEQRVNCEREAEKRADREREAEERADREREAEQSAIREAEQRKFRRTKQSTIVAEELFVPEKVNKIASTNLNNLPSDVLKSKKKACQFLYRERAKKAQIVKVAEQEQQPKFADSVLFAKRNRKRDELMIESLAQSDLKQQVKQPTSVQWNFKSGLDCFDILDEITLNDLKPLSSEYPRKDNEGAPPPVRKPESFYLHKLVYGATQDEFLRLLRMEKPFVPETPPKTIDLPKIELKKTENINKSASNVRKPQAKKLAKKDNASDIIVGKTKQKRSKKNAHDDIVSRLKPYIFDPTMRYPTTITVMPAMITTYTNPHFVKNVNKVVAERNHQVGDHTSKLTKPKPLNKSASASKKISPTRARPKLVRMRGDENRSDYESFPALAAFKQQCADSKKSKTWESNIQNVIEMIETKIVEILADPEKAHLEAFKSVENKILEILNSDNDESIGEPECIKRNFRSKTTDNLKQFREPKNDLRSKTDVSLLRHRPSAHYPLTRVVSHKKSEPNKKKTFEFFDSLSGVAASRHAIEKIFYQRPLKMAPYIQQPFVYYQTSSYGTCLKKLIAQQRPKTPSNQVKVTTSRPKVVMPPKQQIKTPTPTTPTRIIYIDEPIVYNNLLNYLYATLFAIIYFGLAFNYTCQ